MNQPTILVTGATGHVGRPLIAALLAEGARVRALTRDPATAGLPPQAEVAGGDYATPGVLAAAARGADAVFVNIGAIRGGLVDDLLRNWAQSTGQSADIASDLEKIIGRPATTYAQWAAQHADAYR